MISTNSNTILFSSIGIVRIIIIMFILIATNTQPQGISPHADPRRVWDSALEANLPYE